MNKIYTKIAAQAACLALVLASASALHAQKTLIPANVDGDESFAFTYINLFVNSNVGETPDTNALFEYELEAGGVYLWTARETWAFDVSFSSTGDVATLGRPFITRVKIGGGNPGDMYRGTGSLYFDGIEMEIGEDGAESARYETASLRPQGDGYTIAFNDCILYKSRQAIARCDGPNSTFKLTNSHVYNLGDYGELQGNGRVHDPRNGPADSVIIKNNYLHNFLDRLYIGFRAVSANYVEISSNTVFNHVGRHGFVQLTNAKESVIKDNLFINPGIMGSTPVRANEQIQGRDDITEVHNFLLATTEDVAVSMSNNNIFYTQDVLDFYASIDTVSAPTMFNPEFIQVVGDTANAYFSEPLELNNVPGRQRLIEYARATYVTPDGKDLPDIMVEDVIEQGGDFDNGYLFDFSAFDPCYPATARSATAGTNGGAIGATWLCDDLASSVREVASYNSNIQLSITPNPVAAVTNFKFLLTEDSDVSIDVFDVAARTTVNAYSGRLSAGTQTLAWEGAGALAPGVHLVQISTNQGRMIQKIVAQ